MKRVLPVLIAVAAPAAAIPPGIANTPSAPPPLVGVSIQPPPPIAINAITGELVPAQVIAVPPAPGTPTVAYPPAALPRAKAVPAVKIVRGPQPRGAAQDLVTPADYPASARAMGAEGRVGFIVTVGANGRVADCLITRSSDSAALDAATCRLMRSRGRFTPAMDSNGNPAEATIAQEVEWRLP